MADRPLQIMAICTMNICRSPAMEFLLDRQLAQLCAESGIAVDVVSSGTHASVGAPSCDISLAMVGEAARTQTSRQFEVNVDHRPDLVLCAARDHLSTVLIADPELRRVSFTLRQAGRLASWVVTNGGLEMGARKLAGEDIVGNRREPLTLTEPLPAPAAAADRFAWLVAEMDVARGLAPVPASLPAPQHVDDVPDPHVLGFNLHRMSADLITESVTEFVEALRSTLSA